jgi:hypothetical protein
MTEIEELRARVEALEAHDREDANCWEAVRASMHALRERVEALEATQPASPSADRMLALQDQIRDGALTLADAVKEIGGKTTIRPLTKDDGFTVDGWHKDGEFRGQGDTYDGQFYIDGELAKTGGIWQHVAIVASRGAFQPSPTANSSASLTSSPAGSLVERVGNRIKWGIDAELDEDGIAHAAILEVAAALIDWHDSDQVVHTAWEAAKWLEREANR